MGWLIFLLNFRWHFDFCNAKCFSKRALFPIWVGKSFYLTLRWHFDFCIAKIGMPQIGFGKRGLLQNLHTENAF